MESRTNKFTSKWKLTSTLDLRFNLTSLEIESEIQIEIEIRSIEIEIETKIENEIFHCNGYGNCN